ncbi:hypothetical protein BEWA_023260 [Theileria equi strain WA]|uniref:Serine aminopeptidase S33 domain-containing protein n=1 Tax=Theileria equi strain WA TaxID=1537102 RepID=L0AV42_THEEQ|nr:hypothetical protein BEWA_023260 [Theileria equi strain WA]AFZ79477.1 hypothetical protein BEWA_023260 [Theileria equi strain WA]|eukprot:XP_004829143.1 hypothetical protein BEWA_023260 [Theileria equi strain WA]
MNVVVVLLIVCGYFGSFCAKNLGQGSKVQPAVQSNFEAKDAVLDISKIDDEKIDTIIQKPYKLIKSTHFAKNGYRISSVVEGKLSVWKREQFDCDYIIVIRRKKGKKGSRSTNSRLIAVYLKDDEGKKIELHFEKPGSVWKSVDKEDFYDKFHRMVTLSSTLTSVVLSLTGYNSRYLFYSTNSPDFPFAVYAPNVGYRITKVIYHTALGHRDNDFHYVWKKGTGERCVYASFYPRENHKVGYLLIETEDGSIKEKFYIKGRSWGWNSTNKETYIEKLKEAGFDSSTFDNRIVLNVNEPTETHYYKHPYMGNDSDMTLYTVLPGLRLTKIVDDDKQVIWASEKGSYCVFISIFTSKGSPRSFYMLVTDEEHNRDSLYYAKKEDGVWIRIDRYAYYSMFYHPEPSVYTHRNKNLIDDKGNRKVVMSSFRNKDGLKIATYASRVENAKADVILIHGVRSYFASEFGSIAIDWNYKNLDFPLFPDVHKFTKEHFLFDHDMSHGLNYAETYRDVFDYKPYEGQDAFEMMPRCEYIGSGIKFLNDIGYNVYGYDLQSHGFSEGFKPYRRCHVKAYDDYHFDAIQFVSIVKRGKFDDTSEKWDEELLYTDFPNRRKVFFWGNSMGGNITMRAVQEFYKRAKNQNDKLVDGVIGTSPMLNIDTNLDTWYKQWGMHIIRFQTWCHPDRIDYYQPFIDYAESFDLFFRFRDPLFFFKKTTFRSLYALFEGSWDVNKEENLKYYPKDLPTLFINSKKDVICSIVGPYNMMERYLTRETTKLVALEGATHYLAVAQAFVNSAPHFASWLTENTSVRDEL